MKSKFKQWWSTIPLTSTKLTSTLEHNKEHTTYDVGNQGPDLGHAQICERSKPVNGILTRHLMTTGSPSEIQI